MRKRRPIVIVAPGIDREALGLLVRKTTDGLRATAVQAPQDPSVLAAFTGGAVHYERDEPLFGSVRRVVVTEHDTTFFGGVTSGDIAVIRVDGDSDSEERVRRVGDVLAATRAAMTDGVVAGGGAALLQARQAVTGEEPGAQVVRDALTEPACWIAINAGYDGHEAVERVLALPADHGLDAMTGHYGDLPALGIVDPARVVRASLHHAFDIAGTLLTTQALVAEEPVPQMRVRTAHSSGKNVSRSAASRNATPDDPPVPRL
jgi:chaperonin GroEL